MIKRNWILLTLATIGIPLFGININIILTEESYTDSIKLLLVFKSALLLGGIIFLGFQAELNRTRASIGIGAILAETVSVYERIPASALSEFLYILCIASCFYGFFLWIKSSKTKIKHLIHERDSFELLAISDCLTELSNRRAFTEKLSAIPDDTHTIMLVDIDNFKVINDSYGHPAGDAYLKHFADLLVQSTRHIDAVFRIGGEEFAIVVRGSTENAESVAQRLLAKANTTTISWEDDAIGTTCSIGIASLTKECIIKNIENADKCLYFVKTNGKNNYKVHQCLKYS